jgi:hypothetical protein
MVTSDTITITKTEALALVKVADIGTRVVEALGLIQNTTAAQRPITALNQAVSRPRPR